MFSQEQNKIYDVAIIGGGINGVGIALEAASRGLSVVLCEQYDLGSGTSCKSSKMVHGGLRYLEHYDFALVKESLKEREILLSTAGHIVEPLSFIIPYDQNLRSKWMIRLGLHCYDLLNLRNSLPRSRSLQFAIDHANPLKRSIKQGFEYYDCQVDDARLVTLIARCAKQLGADIFTYSPCVKTNILTENASTAGNQLWQLMLQPKYQPNPSTVTARTLINATGPWLDNTLQKVIHQKSSITLKKVKGSHIIVPKLYPQKHAYLLQHRDGRVVFVMPYLNEFTLIGTTDHPYHGDPANVQIAREEIQYLCEAVNQFFHHPLKPQHIYASLAGVRALWDDGSLNLASITRECKIDSHCQSSEHPPLMNIFGGKLTTYRKLGEAVVDQLRIIFPHISASQTAKLILPGGMPYKAFPNLLASLMQQYTFIPPLTLKRLARQFGHDTYELLQNCVKLEDLGHAFGHGLTEQEVLYMIKHEFAHCAEDILWRRTKLGYLFNSTQVDDLAAWFKERMDTDKQAVL